MNSENFINLSDSNPDLFFTNGIEPENGFIGIDSDELSPELERDILTIAELFSGEGKDKVSSVFGVSKSTEGYRRFHTPSVFKDRTGYLIIKFGDCEFKITEEEFHEGYCERTPGFGIMVVETKFGKYTTLVLQITFDVDDQEFWVDIPLKLIKDSPMTNKEILADIFRKRSNWIKCLQSYGQEELVDIRSLPNDSILKVLSARPVQTKFGGTYIVEIEVNQQIIKSWSHNNLNPIIEAEPIFPFTVVLQKSLWKENKYVCKFKPLEVNFPDFEF